MKAPKAPAAPDPKATAAAQTATNIGTAVATQAGSMVNQATPYGNLDYTQRGTYEHVDPLDGKIHNVPLWTATTTLSPQQSVIQGLEDDASQNLAQLAADQSGKLVNYLDTPFKLGNEPTEARLMELGRKRLDPALGERREAMLQGLANRGIGLDSDAASRAMRGTFEAENDAYTQLMLTGRAQANNEQVVERNQPINEISALLSGAQVQQPNFVSTPGFSPATVDYAGLVQQDYSNRMGAYQQQMAQRNSMMGGLFSLGGTALRLGMGGF